jgi:hypothetical protein
MLANENFCHTIIEIWKEMTFSKFLLNWILRLQGYQSFFLLEYRSIFKVVPNHML